MSSPKPASDGSAVSHGQIRWSEARKVSVHLTCYNSLSVGNLKEIQVYFLMVPEARKSKGLVICGSAEWELQTRCTDPFAAGSGTTNRAAMRKDVPEPQGSMELCVSTHLF